MAILTKKFSEFANANLNDSSNQIVGYGAGGNFKGAKVITWTNSTRPAMPFNGLLGYNTDIPDYEYYDSVSAAWVPMGSGGTVFAILASHDPGEGASLIGLNPTGTVQDLADTKFILQMPSAAAPNAQALSVLSTGILKSTTATGLVSISAPLTSIDGLTTAADKMIYTTASNVYATTDLTAFARSLLADNSASTAAATLQVLPLSGGTMSGIINMGGFKITNGGSPTLPTDFATKGYVDSGAFLPLAGGTMIGQIDMGNNKIVNLGNPTSPQDAVTLASLSSTLGNYLLKSGGTMTGAINMGGFGITSLLDPVNPQDAATKNYVDTVAAGLTVQVACYAATDGALTATYANGASGIGATLTNSGALAQFQTDGTTPPTNARILVWEQASKLQNGIYNLTNQGSGAVAWVLTRASDYDQPSEITPGDLVVVQNGTLYATTSFIQTDAVSAVGTDPIEFTQFTFAPSTYLQKANNLSDVSNATTSFNNISPLTTKGDLLTYNGGNTRLAVGSTDGQILQVKAAAATGLSYSTTTYPETTTVNQILYSSSTNVIGGITTANGGVLITNNSGVPSMLANPGAASRILLSGNSAASTWSTYTVPTTPGTAGKIVLSDGTNLIMSTPTYPSTSGTARKIIVSDGTNNVYSTETYATPGASGNLMTSDGTNWTSAPPAATGNASISNILFLMGG